MGLFDFSSTAVKSSQGNQVVGSYKSFAKAPAQAAQMVKADHFGGSGGGFPMGGTGGIRNQYNRVSDRLDEGSIVEDYMPQTHVGVNAMYRLMYLRDVIAGPTVDIWANIPWSEFDITGIKDKSLQRFYQEAFSFWTPDLLSEISREFLVIGHQAGSQLYDESLGYFTDIVPHDPDFLWIRPTPLRGVDPILDLLPTPGTREFLVSADPRVARHRSKMPADLLARFIQGTSVPLEPLSTLWLSRKTAPHDHVGTSFLTRMVTSWAMEKALIDSTVTAARRRAGGVIHVTAGIENEWDPSEDEMSSIADLFMRSEEDPVGGVVLTRRGVEANEVRQGGQVWKISDEWGYLSESKMRALGISQAFLEGDATYSNLEHARSILVEQVLTFRQRLTRQIFTETAKKLARAHGFIKRKEADLAHKVRTDNAPKGKESIKDIKRRLGCRSMTLDEQQAIPDNDLIIPTIHWHKDLKPTQDETFIEMLKTLEEKGIPVPIQTWAAACGYDLEAALEMMPEDKRLRERIAHLTGVTPPMGDPGAGGEEGGGPTATEMDVESVQSKGLDSLPVWNEEQFLKLRRVDAQACLERIQSNPKSLRDHKEMASLVKGMFPADRDKREAMHYLLMRLGLSHSLEMSPPTVKKVAGIICAANTKARTLVSELRILSNVSVSRKDRAASHKIRASQAPNVSQAFRSLGRQDGISSTSPFLLSGK